MTKSERRDRRRKAADDIGMLIVVLIIAAIGSILHASRRRGHFVIHPVEIAVAVLMAVGGYAGVQVRFLEEGSRKKAPYWKRLYAGMNAALGGDYLSGLMNG